VTILRLREAGWTLRRIGRDSRVRMSPEGVRRVLERMSDESDGQVDLLLLWRAARVGDPAAVRGWDRYKARTTELMCQWALERHGVPVDELNHIAHQGLRSKAADAALAEL
jgi:hypothetical protein